MPIMENKISEGVMKVTHRFRGDVTVARRRGIKWALSKNNFIETRLLNFRYFESEQLSFCQNRLKQNPVELMLDIGANFGLYSLHLVEYASVPRVIAFEPVLHNYDRLCKNIALNNRETQIEAYQLALSDVADIRTIHVDSRSTGRSGFLALGEGNRFYSEQVKTAIFDQLFDIEGVTAFIKCDTEGHEFKVLSGMTKFLKRNKIFAQIEVLDATSLALIKSFGYANIGNIGHDTYFTNF